MLHDRHGAWEMRTTGMQREEEVAKVEERRAAEQAAQTAFREKQEEGKRLVNDNAANQEAMQEAEARLQALPLSWFTGPLTTCVCLEHDVHMIHRFLLCVVCLGEPVRLVAGYAKLASYAGKRVCCAHWHIAYGCAPGCCL